MSIYDILLALDLTQSVQAKLCIGMQRGRGGGDFFGNQISTDIVVYYTNIEILILFCIYLPQKNTNDELYLSTIVICHLLVTLIE